MGSQVVRVDPTSIHPESIERAARCIREGGLVAFPTETVYGIAVRADDSAAVERLVSLKQRSERKPMAYYIGELSDLDRFVPTLPAIARRLAERYWPGPLMLVVPDASGKTVGVRFPANPIARALLSGAETSVLATSANLSSQKECLTGDEVAEVFGEGLDLILDGGPADLSEASTIVEVTDQGWRVLREGFIDATAIRDVVTTNLLFVCSGNTCRSPMASALFKALLVRRLGLQDESELEAAGYRIESAGTMAFPGGIASSGAREVMGERGIDLEAHTTSPLSLAALDSADLILAMTEEQARAIASVDPRSAARTHLLDPTGHNTLDPYGGSTDLYRKTAAQIESHLEVWADRLLSEPLTDPS